MTVVQALLAYFRLGSYTIITLSSYYSLRYRVKSIKKVFWGNIIFATLAFLSAFHYVVLGRNLEMVVSWFITIGATIWAALCFTNFVRKSV
jgi:hypothetical protein